MTLAFVMQAGMYKKIGGIIHKYELINTDKIYKKIFQFPICRFLFNLSYQYCYGAHYFIYKFLPMSMTCYTFNLGLITKMMQDRSYVFCYVIINLWLQRYPHAK